MKYRLYKNHQLRVFPGATAVGPAAVTLGAATLEGYYAAFDLILPLIPQDPVQPQMLHKIQAAAGLTFTANEIVTAQAGFGVQVLTFGVAPVPGFVRGELITEALSGNTAIVARRFSDGRYQVINVVGAWGGAPDTVTGGGGGGGTVAGQITAAATVNFRARFDSRFVKDTSVYALYEANMCVPPSARLVGATSGTTCTVTLSEPPRGTLEMENIRTFVGSFSAPAVDATLRVVGLMGDLAQILNPLGANTQVQARVDRGEVWWYIDYPQGTDADLNVNQYLSRQGITGEWGQSTVWAGPGLGPRFQDGVVFRLYQTGGAGNCNGLVASREVSYYDRLEAIVRFGPF